MTQSCDYKDLHTLINKELPPTKWIVVDQSLIDAFADATGDHQWIHIDPERAAKESPFGATIAHGFLTLSLVPYLKGECIEFTGVKMGVNYGTNRVRFTAPVKVDSKLRGRFKLMSVEQIKGGAQMVWECTLELQGLEKPACIAELVSRAYG